MNELSKPKQTETQKIIFELREIKNLLQSLVNR
jgi:hypothetical protein